MGYLAPSVTDTAVTDTTTSTGMRTQSLFRKLEKVTQHISSSAVPEAVRRLRTTVRRIETLIATHAGEGQRNLAKLAKQLSTLRRRAGKVRDLDVQLTALQGVRTEAGRHEKVVLTRHLTAVRDKCEKKLLGSLQDEIDGGLRKRMQRGMELLDNSSRSDAAKDFTAEALRKFRELVEDHPPLTEENLHEFRLECKRIRYLAEMSVVTPATARIVAALKRVQDAMGDWHDWFTLTETAQEVLASPASPFLAALRAYRRASFNEALRVIADVRKKLLNEIAVPDTGRAANAASPGLGGAKGLSDPGSPKPPQSTSRTIAKRAAG